MNTPKLLVPYERNSKRLWLSRPHPIVLVAFLGYLAAGLLCGYVVIDTIANESRNFVNGLIIIFGGLVGLQMLGLASLRGITYFTNFLMITDPHLIIQHGIARQLSVLEHKDIELTGTTETLLGRLLGYGRLLAAPASGDFLPTFPIRNPNSLEVLVNECRKRFRS